MSTFKEDRLSQNFQCVWEQWIGGSMSEAEAARLCGVDRDTFRAIAKAEAQKRAEGGGQKAMSDRYVAVEEC